MVKERITYKTVKYLSNILRELKKKSRRKLKGDDTIPCVKFIPKTTTYIMISVLVL